MTSQGDQPGACICCGARNWRELHKEVRDYISGERFDVIYCAGCGLGMTQPAPSLAAIAKYYPPRYRGARHALTGRFRTARRARALQRLFPPGFRGRLLDLGAGSGDFALYMRNSGWEVSATEIDAAGVELLRARGIDARLASAGGERWEAPFDAITAWHVLEHVGDPEALLQSVHRSLSPDGVFQLAVPNLQSLQARLGGRHWFHLDVPRHLFHFTPGALEQLLGRHGLEVQSRSTFALEYDWFGVIQTPLNALLPRANVLFEGLTMVDTRLSATLIGSAVLAPLIGVATILPASAAALFGAGATLRYTCRGSN